MSGEIFGEHETCISIKLNKTSSILAGNESFQSHSYDFHDHRNFLIRETKQNP